MFPGGFLVRARHSAGRRNVDIDPVTASPLVAMPIYCSLSWEFLARIEGKYLIGYLGGGEPTRALLPRLAAVLFL